MKIIKKGKLLTLLCVGMIMTGCADQMSVRQKETAYPLDMDGKVREDEDTPEDTIERIPNNQNVHDNEHAQDLYMGFLKNEVPAIVSREYPHNLGIKNNLERGSAYTI